MSDTIPFNGTARLVEWHAIRTHCRGGSQPPAFVPGPGCSVEWYHVRHSTNSPKLIRDCGFVPRGRLRASPTVSSGCCTNSPNPVHHFWLVLRGRLVAAPTVAWMSFVPAKLQLISLTPNYGCRRTTAYIIWVKSGSMAVWPSWAMARPFSFSSARKVGKSTIRQEVLAI